VANSVRANRAVRSPGAEAASTETGDAGMRVRAAGHRPVPPPLTALPPIVPAAWPTMAHAARTLTAAAAPSNSRRRRMPAGLPASRPSGRHFPTLVKNFVQQVPVCPRAAVQIGQLCAAWLPAL
jgi:hypothetical protein